MSAPLAPQQNTGGTPAPATLTIGVVAARTGRLATLGDPLAHVTGLLRPALTRLVNSGRTHPVRIVARDSRSTAEGGRRAVHELVHVEGAHVVVTLAGTQVLPAVADACEEAGTACVSSTFPWQVYYYGRGAADAADADDAVSGPAFRSTFHFCWGLDDIAEVFADLWELAGGPARTVGCLWNDGPQGNWSRHERHGFAPAARARGHRLVDPGGYREPGAAPTADRAAEHTADRTPERTADHETDRTADLPADLPADLTAYADAFDEAGADIVTSAATARDLAAYRALAAERGRRPRLITCSRWLAYPPSVAAAPAYGPADRPAQADVATLVYWTPFHPYRSSLDGTTAAELAESYGQSTGRQWLQPLGLAYALFEVAAHALRTAADPTDRAAVAKSIARTRLDTVAGPLDWTTGPVPNVATLRLAGGQWQPTHRSHHAYDLAILTNRTVPHLPLTADLSPTG